jgi:hypothetical protein
MIHPPIRGLPRGQPPLVLPNNRDLLYTPNQASPAPVANARTLSTRFIVIVLFVATAITTFAYLVTAKARAAFIGLDLVVHHGRSLNVSLQLAAILQTTHFLIFLLVIDIYGPKVP